MTATTRCVAIALTVAGMIVALPDMAAAQSYPTKPIRVVVPGAAGGISDIVARLMSDRLDKTLNQRILVENRGGAGANLGAELVAKSAGDGYTLCLCNVGNVAILPHMLKDMTYDAMTDLVAVAPIGETPELVAVNAKFPVKTFQDLIAYAKANPGRVNYGTPGPGSPPHLAGVLMERLAGVQLTHIPYKGAAPAVIDLSTGQIEMAIAGLGSYFAQFKAGTIRILVAAHPHRLKSLPDVPSAPEAGLPGFEATVWFGVLAPKGTPGEVIALLNRRINEMLDEPDIVKKLEEGGLEVMRQTPAEFAAQIKRDNAKWGEIVKSTDVKME